MAKPIVLAVDVMGGDHGPATILAGLDLALCRRPDLRFCLFGNAESVVPLLDGLPNLKAASSFQHTNVAVSMDEKPSQALRHGRWKSSMWLAIDAVKRGDAEVAISAGNTGALTAMARFCLRTLPNIEKPAIAAIWPTLRSESIVLDVGATIGATAEQLVDFAVMGGAMARALFQLDKATVGLLNIGVEEVKGNDNVRQAGQLLREARLDALIYEGFVEGDDIGRGRVDVIVTEGFAGNIALKTAEGTARQVGAYLRSAMSRTLFSRLGYLFARAAFERLRDKMDPRKLNGGVLLGLNGLVVKSHGGADAEGFASALDLGYDMARSHLHRKIAEDIARYHQSVQKLKVVSG